MSTLFSFVATHMESQNRYMRYVSIVFQCIRWGPYNGGNCPNEILPWPSKVEILTYSHNVPLGIRFGITVSHVISPLGTLQI